MRRRTLLDIATHYVGTRSLSHGHRRQFLGRARHLERYAQTTTPRKALREPVVNSYLREYAATRKPTTVVTARVELLTLWSHAAQIGAADEPDRASIWRPRTRFDTPDCYSLDEVRALLAGCEGLTGAYGNVPAASYWEALIRVAWDTGLRRGDLMRVRAADVRPDGLLVTTASKTGGRVIHRLAAETVVAITRVGSLAWPLSEVSFTNHYNRLRDATVGRGQFKWLRRASGSYVAMEHGDAAGASHLGHASLTTFRRYYDARLVGGHTITPPTL